MTDIHTRVVDADRRRAIAHAEYRGARAVTLTLPEPTRQAYTKTACREAVADLFGALARQDLAEPPTLDHECGLTLDVCQPAAEMPVRDLTTTLTTAVAQAYDELVRARRQTTRDARRVRATDGGPR